MTMIFRKSMFGKYFISKSAVLKRNNTLKNTLKNVLVLFKLNLRKHSNFLKGSNLL